MRSMSEIAADYAATAEALARRAAALRRVLRRDGTQVRARAELTRIDQQLREARALAELCARYYDPGYFRPPEYTLQGDICNDDKRRHGCEDAGRDGAGVD